MSTCAHLEAAALDRVLHAEADLKAARRRVETATRRPLRVGLDGALRRLQAAEAALASAQYEHRLLQSLVHHEQTGQTREPRRQPGHLGLVDVA